MVRDELRTLESSKRDFERTLIAAHDDQVIEPHPNMAELYRKKVSELQTLLTDEAACPQTIDIIRFFIALAAGFAYFSWRSGRNLLRETEEKAAETRKIRLKTGNMWWL